MAKRESTTLELNTIVCFTIEIERIEGKWKLNHDSERRLRVVRSLQKSGGHQELQIADLMLRTLPDESGVGVNPVGDGDE